MHLNINHQTRYCYDSNVDYTIQQLRLTPQDGFGQRVKSWELRVNGELQSHADAFGNIAHTLVLDHPHKEINITAYGEVETEVDAPAPKESLPLTVYLRQTMLTSVNTELANFAEQFRRDNTIDEGGLWALMQGIHSRIHYQKGLTNVATSASETFKLNEGVCQDYAHIFIACCRHLGIPARYVSGYLFTASGNLVESHAWADAWVNERWLSYDISNGKMANGVHVRLATGLDYRDACPISGVRHGGGVELMNVQVQMTRSQQQ
jgi:transglutaminase-like putative cysteine protease